MYIKEYDMIVASKYVASYRYSMSNARNLTKSDCNVSVIKVVLNRLNCNVSSKNLSLLYDFDEESVNHWAKSN